MLKRAFQIGQIVYILSEEAETIIPAIVVEEQTIRKLDGQKVSWKIGIGPANKRKEMDSNNIKGELYSSLEEIKAVMVERLTKFVDDLVLSAEKRTNVWYDKNTNNLENKIDPVLLSKEFDNSSSSSSVIPSNKEELRKHLLNNMVENDEDKELSVSENNFIIGENGEKIPVKFNIPLI